MKQKILLLMVMISFVAIASAQKKQQPVTGYAITSSEKGGKSWKEVRLINISSGEEIKSIYQSKQETQALNARTGNPVRKKDAQNNVVVTTKTEVKKIVRLDDELAMAHGNFVKPKPVIIRHSISQYDNPFATNSAAAAYDKKNERLYYTPMGINQLRYIDLKTNKVYYFEDEPFGKVSSFGDVSNQITRMVIASDGHGYALTNDGNNLIRFTTNKKPVISDLGALTDDAGNGNSSVHSRNGFGGDMIADASGNLYLITANRNVFKINIENKVAAFMGTITGLPKGYTTNAAMVEEGSKVIVGSSQSTEGYFRFDLNTMEAEKISQQDNVYNVSDLANANLAFAKKKKERNEETTATEETVAEEPTKKASKMEIAMGKGISIYPNPVTNGAVKVSFEGQPAGKYQVQLLDIAGKLISSKEVIISNNMQVEEIRLPELIGKGNYLLKVVGTKNKVSVSNKLVVQ
jgi:hypothetical protein